MKTKKQLKQALLFGAVLLGVCLMVLFSSIVWLMYSNIQTNERTQPLIEEVVIKSSMTDSETSLYYFMNDQQKYNFVMSNWSNFEELKNSTSLVFLLKFYDKHDYFSVTNDSFLDRKNSDLYFGLLKTKKAHEDTNCNYITDIVKVNLLTHDYEIVYVHNDCTNTLPNIAPAEVVSVVDGRYLTLSVAICSECSASGSKPVKTFTVDLLAE